MPGLHAHIDPEGLEEFSVVFTDRSLNHMSARFQGVMRDVSGLLKEVYRGSAVALVPGGGSYAMEAVARQFGKGNVLIVRNGWFSFRWTQIFDAGGFASATTVVMARQTGNDPRAPYAPPPVEEVVAIARENHGKLPMGVASGGSKHAITKVLTHLGIVSWFGAIVTNEDVVNQKPAPDIFLEAARRLGVAPQFCRAFEDTDLGMQAIRAAGMDAVDIRHHTRP